LYGLFLFIGAFIASYRKGDVRFNKHQKKIILGSAILLALILPFVFLITQAARMGVEKLSLTNVTRLFDYLKVWFAGNISAFSIWYDTFQNQIVEKGQFTFGGIFELLNISRRKVGIYSVSYDVDGHMAFTNIYTVFRFLLDDFGAWGTCLFLIILGTLCKRLYVNSINGSLTSTAILSGILTFLLFSFISSVWAYNTVLFAWIIFILICFSIENMFVNAE
jgi:oligosaccharide repeat unit polymerase